MDNPTRPEAAYDRLDTFWPDLPFVRANGRAQAAPFVVLLLVVSFALSTGLVKLIDHVGVHWTQETRAALFLGGYLIGGFALLIVAMIRSARRQMQGRPMSIEGIGR